jgi:Ca-activated chloride channel family protein
MAAPSLSRLGLTNTITLIATSWVLAGITLAGLQFTSGVSVVEVYATVTDERGEPMTGLSREDFHVTEDGQPQTVSTFAAGDFPLSVAVGLDRSFSMSGEPLAVVKSAARIFLGELRPRDEAALIAIGSTVDVIAALSVDRESQYAALAALDAFGTTGLYDAVVRAIELTQPGKGRRALVLLSDGRDRYSTATADDALATARHSDVMVYPIAIGRERPEAFASLATLTGGRSVHVRDARALPETLKSIARELRYQYLLGYTPTRPPVPGSNQWRSITVRVERPQARVRARDGYLVR